MTATFVVAFGGVLVGWLLRYVVVEGRKHREAGLEPYPQRIPEPLSNVWLDDDTDGLTVD